MCSVSKILGQNSYKNKIDLKFYLYQKSICATSNNKNNQDQTIDMSVSNNQELAIQNSTYVCECPECGDEGNIENGGDTRCPDCRDGDVSHNLENTYRCVCPECGDEGNVENGGDTRCPDCRDADTVVNFYIQSIQELAQHIRNFHI